MVMVVVVALALAVVDVAAQPAPSEPSPPSVPSAPSLPLAPSTPQVIPIFRAVTRLESWSFFAPPVTGGDPTYSLLSNRATLGVLVNSPRVTLQGAFQYSQVFGLPRRAVGPGPLGPGALYYAAASAPAAYQLFFKALSLRVNLTRGLSIEAGRMGFASGGESSLQTGPVSSMPSLRAVDSADALEALKRARLTSLLIGEVEWSIFERAFDGVRVDFSRKRWHANAALLLPTQGVFEESASPTMGSLRILNGSVTRRFKLMSGYSASAPESPRSELQLFALHYRDYRDIHARPDNTGLPTGVADLNIATLGAAHAGVYRAGGGEIDAVVWIARQWGDWYGDAHRATSVIAEGGYRWSSAGRPWIRGGVVYASGDDNPADFRHGTFFPMVPTTRPGLLAGTYAQMNLRDAFAQLRVQPNTRLGISADVHRLSLVEKADRWYGGTGATAFRGNFFGYTGRLSSLATSLGTLVELSADGRVSSRWTLKGSLGTVKGGEVVRRLFAGSRLTIVALESAFSF